MNAFLPYCPIVLYLVLPVGLIYVFLISFFYAGWKKIPHFRTPEKIAQTGISVIIPVRNEEGNLPGLISDLNKQNYPNEYFEIILVNDHSTDRSVEIIKDSIAGFSYISLADNPGRGKKQAIIHGANLSHFDFIITSDADCRRGKNWLAAFAGFLHENKPRMILGPVLPLPGAGFLEKAKALEFISLVASGAGAAGQGHPIMANGANLGFYKEELSLTKNPLKEEIPSGDDLFLMLNVKKNDPGNILFLKSGDAAVYTAMPKTWKSFLLQRKRWVSKSRFYRDFDLVFTALVVFLTNLLLTFSLIAGFFSISWLMGFFALWILKMTPDLIFLRSATRFFGLKKLMRLFFPVQLIYFIYVSFAAFVGLMGGSYTWKGRKEFI